MGTPQAETFPYGQAAAHEGLRIAQGFEYLRQNDPTVYLLIGAEAVRQANTLMMIPSENIPSAAVAAAESSLLSWKYAEGYPNARYYQGNEFVDQVELEAITRTAVLFGVPQEGVNVQPYSGSPANSAVYQAVMETGDVLMGLSLDAGGHLTHGAKPSATGKLYTSVQYGVVEDGLIDYDQMERLALEHRPKVIVAGTTAYPRLLDWERFAKIADKSGAILMADMSHIAGLVAGRAYPSPVPFVDVITTTTHKTLRGPRGAIIMVTDKGLSKDSDLGKKINRSVFPGLQGGPHINTIGGIAVALGEAQLPQFRDYAQNVIDNASELGRALERRGIKLVTGGTDSHLLLVDLSSTGVGGKTAAEGLERAGIVGNFNSIPFDRYPRYPSGVRLGTPALTSRGMGTTEMQVVGELIADVVDGLAETQTRLGVDRSLERSSDERKRVIEATPAIANVKSKVENLTAAFPIPTTYF